jgi:predicted nuclease of predicted toxin-antitoxin system
MEFKVDENLPIEVAEVLRNAGHGALTIQDQLMVGNPDPQVAAVCQAEGRALVTLDLDFSNIRTYPPADYHGIVVLRPHSQAKPSVLNLISLVLPTLSTEPLKGNLWIVEENGVRIREG